MQQASKLRHAKHGERETKNTKSWVAFKLFSSKYHDLKEQQQVNTKYAGYHSANMVREVDQKTHKYT